MDLSSEFLSPQGRGFLALHNLTSGLNCFDPRDRLYAIRALVMHPERHYIIPDYSRNAKESFTNFTSRFFRQTGNGDLLTRCLLRDPPSKLQMPSWIPDFSATNVPVLFPDFAASCCPEITFLLTNESMTVQAVKIATITSLSSLSSPLKSSFTAFEIIKALRILQISCRSITYPNSGSISDAFIDAIVGGHRAEMLPAGFGPRLSLKQCKEILEACEADGGSEHITSLKTIFARRVRLISCGRVFFKTREGFVGICPESAEPGDVVVVVLGVSQSLVLRPVIDQRNPCYRIVGASYVPGAMHMEILLGPIPVGWHLSYKIVNGRLEPVFTNGNIVTQQDPRVPLPPGWMYRYGSFEEFGDMDSNLPEDMLPQFFENGETQKKTWIDPRLTPEALRERGVDFQELVLV